MSLNHDTDRLPSLRSLQVFEVAARHQSFTAAAEELCVTQGAVSRQVQELEQSLDTQLFVRSGPHITLTVTGSTLAGRIGYAMDSLREAVQMARPTSESRYITLSILPSLNTKWIAPRLGQFIQSHPDVELRIAASRDLVVDFDIAEIDAAIRYGAGKWANLKAELLATETVTPVCTRAYAEQIGLKEPRDLINATLLETASSDNWVTWFRAAGVESGIAPKGTYLGDGAAILQAAIDSQGVAMGRSVLIADDLQNERLFAPFQLQLKSTYSYWFVTPPNKTTSANLNAVRDWLMQSFHDTL